MTSLIAKLACTSLVFGALFILIGFIYGLICSFDDYYIGWVSFLIVGFFFFGLPIVGGLLVLLIRVLVNIWT